MVRAVRICGILVRSGGVGGDILRRLRVGHGAVLGGDAHLRKRLPRTLIAERCQPTLQSRIAARVHCHIGAEFRVFIGDFRQQDRIGIGILHCCDGLVIINHRDLFP